MKTERTLKIDHAIKLLTEYEACIKATANEGNFFEHLYNLCSSESDYIDNIGHHLTLSRFIVIIANPDVQAEILKCQNKNENLTRQLISFINLLGKLIEFFDVMKGEQFDAMLKKECFKVHGEAVDLSDDEIDYQISYITRKLKSLPQKTN